MKDFILTYILIPQAEARSTVGVVLGRINENVINPGIRLLFVLAFVFFILGLYKFLGNKEDQNELEEGKNHMKWGVIGMAIMVSVFGIMNFITNTLGVGTVDPGQSDDVSGLIQN